MSQQFSFNGEFRRRPQQNLGGSSKISEEREQVLQRAREDRERRQRERLIAKSIVVIQSCVRSFLTRARMKNLWRTEFDKDKSAEYSYETFVLQINRLNAFYTHKKDAKKLEHLAESIPRFKAYFVPNLYTDINWQMRLRAVILTSVRHFNAGGIKKTVLLAMIDELTDMSSDDIGAIRWGTMCWLHMIEFAEFFDTWRAFMARKIPKVTDPRCLPPPEKTSVWSSYLIKPFIAINKYKNLNGADATLGVETLDLDLVFHTVLYKFTLAFCTKFIIPSYLSNPLVAHVAFPALCESHAFPWMKWIQTLNIMLPNPKCSFVPIDLRCILYANLSLFDKSIPASPVELAAILDCLTFLLSSVDNTVGPIPNLAISDYYMMDYDDDFVKNMDSEIYYQELSLVYEKLQHVINGLKIAPWMEPFDNQKWCKLYPIIGYIIRLEPKLASTNFDFLPALAYNRNFIRSLYLQIVSSVSPKNEEISAFCWFFCHLIATLHDAEFAEGIPIQRSEIPILVRFLTDIYNHSVIEDKDSKDPIAITANKAVISMLRALHDRNTRIQIFLEEEFHSSFSSIMPVGSHSIRFDENLTIPSEVRLAPLEMKLLRILREFPYALSFHDRVTVWNRMIQIDRGDRFHGLGSTRENIQIRRSLIYEDAYEKLSQNNVKNLRGLVRITLVNIVGALEAGVDGGGLLREFLIEATRAAVDPNRGFFRVDTQNRIYPNPVAKKLFPDFRNHYFFMGRLVGKALYEQTHLELPFAAFFIQTWITGNVSSAVDYLATLDPALHKNLLQLKDYNGDWQSLSIDFTLTMDELGETRIVELKHDGKNILVDRSNIIEYIHLVADYKINKEMEEECRWFRAGIYDVVPMLHIFSWREMQTLISGSDKPIDLEDWAANVNYAGGFTPEHPTIILFWKVLNSFEEKDLRKLLKFVTSCSRPPILGFKDLIPKFGIQNVGVTDRFPTASTCMNLLKLPELHTEKELREKIMYVIQAEAGFELS